MVSAIIKKLDKHFGTYPLRQIKKGQILIHADDKPSSLYYLTKGRVRQYDITYRGDEVVVNVFKPPAFFPMHFVLTGDKNRFFFEADTDIEVRLAPPEETLQFLRENPDVTLDLLTRLYKGVDGLLGRMVHLMSGSAKSRLMYELIIETKRFGTVQDDGSHFIAVHENDLAGRTGLSRETVSREMHKIKRLGLAKVTRQGITIYDLAVLEARLGSEL